MKPITIVSVWNPKGGQGKSMLALNLAAACKDIDKKAMIICKDPQGTAMLYHNKGNLDFEVVQSKPEKRPDVDIIFVDHPGTDWEVPKSNIIVMPLIPRRDQYATFIDAYKRAEKKKKNIITVVTNGDKRRETERKLIENLEGKGALNISSSGIFGRAANDYRTIFDKKLRWAYKVNERRGEIAHILDKILESEKTNP